jgi:putative ABC transport system permease protein
MDSKISINRPEYSKSWLWKMAWRDSRRSRSRLFLFTSSIILGITALVAINSFKASLFSAINDQAKGLLGADLVVRSSQPFTEDYLPLLDSIGTERSSECYFASMIYFPRSQGTRLVQVRALEGEFPYYGAIETDPIEAARSFRGKKQALVDQTLMLQFGVEIGDEVKVGTESFEIVGRLQKIPGQTGITTTVAPVVYIPYEYVEQTGLLQKGSRINYMEYFRFDDEAYVKTVEETYEKRFDQLGWRYDTVEEQKEDTGRAFKDLTGFLNLVAFVALLLGCIGVASAVHIYIKEKITSVAVIRCLGGTSIQAFFIFLIQIASIGLLGGIIGSVLGSVLQMYLPGVLKDFLPVTVDFALSWSAILQGIALGLSISVLFALPPLLRIRKVAPLQAIRAGIDGAVPDSTRGIYPVYAAILAFILGFAWWQIGSILDALSFTGGLIAAFLLLAGVAKLITWSVKKFFPITWSYVWRQGLANLFRPQNQTMILIITVGLGTALISTLYLVQQSLISQVSITGAGDRPNMVLFDIQSDQKEAIKAMTLDYDLPVIQDVPVVTMRLEELKGYTKKEAEADTTLGLPDWAYNREYRITYRDSLIDSEEIIAGKWLGKIENPNDTIFISMSDGYAENLGVKVGDEMLFNVQGALIKTYVGSLRRIDWNRVQTNFLVIFPEGVLEKAPQFHVLITRVENNELSARFQQAVVRNYPNVSIIDLQLILSTLDDILGKVSFVIQFMALLSISTGILVLIASVVISKFQRIQEGVLLRTLGASRRQVLTIAGLEYLFLGVFASCSGILLSLAGSWALSYFVFESTFSPVWLPLLAIIGGITTLTVAIGVTNSQEVVNNPPLEVLRREI